MIKRIKSSLFLTTFLAFSNYSSLATERSGKSIDLANIDIPINVKKTEATFFDYLNQLKDGQNDSIIERAKQVYKTNPSPIITTKVNAAIQYLKTAATTSSAVSEQLTQAHQKELGEVKKKLSETEQNVQKVQHEKQLVEHEKQKAEEKAVAAEQRAKKAEEKAGEVANEFAHKMGAAVVELASIRYLAYQSPDIYRKTLESFIKASEGINNLIIDYQKDIKIEKLVQYIRLPIVPLRELKSREENLKIGFSEVHKYLKEIFDETNNDISSFNNPLMKLKIEAFKEKCEEIKNLLDQLKDVKDIVKFFQNVQIMKELASNIENLLGTPSQSMGSLYSERNGTQKEAAYHLCSHLYELHSFIVNEGQTKNFQKRDDYFTGFTPSNPFKPIPKAIKNISILDKKRQEYVDAQIASLLTNLFGHQPTVSLAQMKQEVDRANSAQKTMDQFLKTTENGYSIAYKRIMADENKSFVPQLYKAMKIKFKDAKEKEVTEELKIWVKKLEESGKTLMDFLKNLQSTKEQSIFDFSKESDQNVLMHLNKSYEGLLKFIQNQPQFAQKVIHLSGLIDKMPDGAIYIKDLTQKVENALNKHKNFQLILKQLQSLPANVTEGLINAEVASPETIPNLNTVKSYIKDIVFKNNYLTTDPKERSESFSYALGSLGLDIPGVWITPVSPDIHKEFLKAYEAYKEARDALLMITGEAIDDTQSFMVISDFTDGNAPAGAVHGVLPPGHGGRGGPPPPPGGRLPAGGHGGPPPPPGRLPGGTGAPKGAVNLLASKPTNMTTIGSKTYQQEQDQAIKVLIETIDAKIDNLLKDKGKNAIKKSDRKQIEQHLYLFLWGKFYAEIQKSYEYLDVGLMSPKEAIEFVTQFITSEEFEQQLNQKLTDLKL